MWSCGGDSGAFCHRVRGAGGGEGAVWSNPGGGVGGDLLFRGRTHEKVERSIALLEEMWGRRRREMDRQMQGPTHL